MTDQQVCIFYSGRATNWPAIWLSTALVVPLLAMAQGSHGSWTDAGVLVPLTVVAAAVLVNLFTASSVRTIAGANGVSVHFGVFGWPRFHYPVDRIQQAERVELSRSMWAWGLYWSPRRGLMLTLRNGPALRLTLTNGKRVTITTADPDAAVQAIAAARFG